MTACNLATQARALQDLRKDWPPVVRRRLEETVLPLLASARLRLVVALTVMVNRRWARLDTRGYLGFERLRGKPALIFAAHLGNWELPALIATRFALDATILYRRPNISVVSDAIIKIRKDSMGTLVATTLDAPFKLVRVLESGGRVAMLVDQYYVNGVDVTFFGRPCKANPFIARLAQHVDCPIYGTRVVRIVAHLGPRRARREGSRRERQEEHE